MFKNISGIEKLILLQFVVTAVMVIAIVFAAARVWEHKGEIFSKVFSIAVPDNVVTRPYNEYCEKDYILKEMIVFDHATQKSTPILIGSKELIDKALLVSSDPKPLYFICEY